MPRRNMLPDADIVRLRHMLDAAEEACRFLKHRNVDDLASDTMLNFAIRHAIEIIGEAASKISPEGREALPNIPWRRVIGMRNRLIHAYFDVSPAILYDTVILSLPVLIAELAGILKTEQ